MSEWKELYRAFIPRNRILNDNHSQHYRAMQGKLSYLSTQFEAFENNDGAYNSVIGGFKIVDAKNNRAEIISEDAVLQIRCEAWRPNNILFDPFNYSKTFKMPIDKLTKNDLIGKDDNWKFISEAVYAGGGANAWGRSYKSRSVNYNDEPVEICDGYLRVAEGEVGGGMG